MEKSPLIFGLILQSSMILAVGAQNLFVLEKGLLKDRPGLVAGICSLIDVSLIFLGVLGAGTFFSQNATLTFLLKLGGALFLLKYAFDKFREAGKSSELKMQKKLNKSGVKSIILSSMGVSLLNPHVYLDTIVLIGGYSTKFPTVEDKLSFAIGAGLLSIIWFFSISYGAGLFSNALKNPKFMGYVNYASSFIMTYLGVNLFLSL